MRFVLKCCALIGCWRSRDQLRPKIKTNLSFEFWRSFSVKSLKIVKIRWLSVKPFKITRNQFFAFFASRHTVKNVNKLQFWRIFLWLLFQNYFWPIWRRRRRFQPSRKPVPIPVPSRRRRRGIRRQPELNVRGRRQDQETRKDQGRGHRGLFPWTPQRLYSFGWLLQGHPEAQGKALNLLATPFV